MSEVLRCLINSERQRHGMGVRQLARAASLHPTVVSQLLNGKRAMSLKNAEKLANAMGCELTIKLTEIEP